MGLPLYSDTIVTGQIGINGAYTAFATPANAPVFFGRLLFSSTGQVNISTDGGTTFVIYPANVLYQLDVKDVFKKVTWLNPAVINFAMLGANAG